MKYLNLIKVTEICSFLTNLRNFFRMKLFYLNKQSIKFTVRQFILFCNTSN